MMIRYRRPNSLWTADERKNIVIGGNFRLKVIKRSLGLAEAPYSSIYIPDLDKEKELCLR